jgi:hypothetical protein
MSNRGDGYTWVNSILKSGWPETRFKGMNNPWGTLQCLCHYFRTGHFTEDQKEQFLQQINTHYRKYCFANGLVPAEPPLSLKKYFKK